jgi:hypothetical protein
VGAAVDEVEVVSSVVVGSEAVGATVVGRPLHLPHLVDLPALQRLPRQVEELAHLAGGALIGEQIHIQRKVDQHWQTTGQVIHLPGSTVGEDDPLRTFIDRIHLYLTQMLGSQLGGDPLHLDESDQFTVEARAVVCELPLTWYSVVRSVYLSSRTPRRGSRSPGDGCRPHWRPGPQDLRAAC